MAAFAVVAAAICTVVFLDVMGGSLETVTAKSIFEFSIDSISNDAKTSLTDYRGKKAYLIVNVASK